VRLHLQLPRNDASRRLLTHAGLAVSGFLLAWLFIAFVVFPDDGAASVVTVPAVVGLTYDDAARRLADSGLDASLGESRLSGEAPKSTVLAQTPVAGSRLLRGAKVALDVSAGQQRATIPDLTGRSRSAAEEVLRDAGLQLGQVTERASDHARGTVLSTRPAVGQIVPAGTAVDLEVSLGPAELSMPDVVGHDLSEARSTLEQLGLTIGDVTYDSTSTFPSGRVLQQTPVAGAAVLPRTPVSLRVSGKR
jgi:serine/threonine-protein kinase